MSKASEEQLVRAMQRRTARLTPELRMAWAQAVQQLRQQLSDDRVASLITSGRIDELLTPEVLDDSLRELRRGMASGVQGAAVSLVGTLPDVAQVAFTLRANPRVLDAIRTLDSTLLQGWKRDARETVRGVVEQGLRDGVNPRAVARDLRSAVGLAPHQWQEVRNYRAALEERLEMARTSGKLGNVRRYTLRDKRFDGMVARRDYTPAQIDTMVDRYVARRTADHASTIARTAALNANRAGQDAAFRSAIDAGLVDAERAFKTWRSVGDSRVRDDHRAMNGERVRYQETFTNGQEYPNEYNCRCVVSYTMVARADLNSTTSARDAFAMTPDEARLARNAASRKSKAKARGRVGPPPVVRPPVVPPVVVRPPVVPPVVVRPPVVAPVVRPPVVPPPVVGPPAGITETERKRLARNEASRRSKAKARGGIVLPPTPRGAAPIPLTVTMPMTVQPYGTKRSGADAARRLMAQPTAEEKAWVNAFRRDLNDNGNPLDGTHDRFTPEAYARTEADRALGKKMFRKAMLNARNAQPSSVAAARNALPVDVSAREAQKVTLGYRRHAADKVSIKTANSTVGQSLDETATWLADVMGVPPGTDNARRVTLVHDAKVPGAYYRSFDKRIVLGGNKDTGTLIHEFMHHMQDSFRGIRIWEEASRLKFQTSGDLINIAPMLGYHREVMHGYVGNFFTGYMGRIYPEDWGTEWLTVGIQAMFYDPASMARHYPELFNEFAIFMRRVGTRKVFHD